MPRYKVEQQWSEVVYYSNVVYVEADDEDAAREIAADNMDFDNGDTYDSEYCSGSFETGDIIEVDARGRRVETPIKKERNLPKWW
jgi:hypothetical protein